MNRIHLLSQQPNSGCLSGTECARWQFTDSVPLRHELRKDCAFGGWLLAWCGLETNYAKYDDCKVTSMMLSQT